MMKTLSILSIFLVPVISFSQIQHGGMPIANIDVKEINFLSKVNLTQGLKDLITWRDLNKSSN